MGTETDHRWARNANRLRAQEHSHSPSWIELTRCGYRRRNAIVDSTQERGLLANQLQTVQNNEAICAIFQAAIWQSYRGRLRSWASGSISRNRRKADTLPERLHNKERQINLLVNRPSSRKKQSNTHSDGVISDWDISYIRTLPPAAPETCQTGTRITLLPGSSDCQLLTICKWTNYMKYASRYWKTWRGVFPRSIVSDKVLRFNNAIFSGKAGTEVINNIRKEYVGVC